MESPIKETSTDRVNKRDSSTEGAIPTSNTTSSAPPATSSPSKSNLKRSQPNLEEFQSKSPAKKLRLDPSIINPVPKEKKPKDQFIYGNYSRYYNYRHPSEQQDVRLIAFRGQPHLFTNKDILDIGCNDGAVTVSIARDFGAKHVHGIDIDKQLINRAKKNLTFARKSFTENNNKESAEKTFPFNVKYDHCNYILDHDCLLEMETSRFDTILCLSVTKWIHLNFGDSGLKQAFRRMYKQLKPNGCLILEAQNWQSYKRRKKLTPEINKNYQHIQLFPNKFDEYLLSEEVGFKRFSEITLPEHPIKGFQRPIKVFYKTEEDKPGETTKEVLETTA